MTLRHRAFVGLLQQVTSNSGNSREILAKSQG